MNCIKYFRMELICLQIMKVLCNGFSNYSGMLYTNLIETLIPPISQYNHQKGCGTATKVMKEKLLFTYP